VTLARGSIIEPEVLLLDEPFNPLDAKLRGMMQVELRKLVKRLGIASIFVTHDQTEALTLSDRIAVMREGVIEQLSEPLQIYDAPATTTSPTSSATPAAPGPVVDLTGAGDAFGDAYAACRLLGHAPIEAARRAAATAALAIATGAPKPRSRSTRRRSQHFLRSRLPTADRSRNARGPNRSLRRSIWRTG
jgi:energy-coupling factor transporter ATP-binding protein EcfA2